MKILVIFSAVLLAFPTLANAIDDYPYKSEDPSGVDPWNFYYRECTSFVAWRMNNNNGVPFTNNMGGGWGNAHNWDDNAALLGYDVDTNPEVGAIAQWNINEGCSCPLGHVAWVQSVNANGSAVIEEYNADGNHNYGTRTVFAPRYIHIGTTNTSWLFNTDNNTEGWAAVNIQGEIVLDDIWTINPNPSDPQQISPLLSQSPSSINYMKIGVKNKGSNTLGKVYYSGPSHGYSEDRMAAFTNPNNGLYNWITIRLDDITGWNDASLTNLDHIRIDPVNSGSASDDMDDVLVDYIFLRKDNTNPSQPTITSVSPSTWTNGSITVSFESNDPPDVSPVGPDVYGAGISKFMYRVDPQADAQIYPTSFNDRTGLASASVTYTPGQLAQGTNSFHVYCFDKVGRVSIDNQVNLYFDSTAPTNPATVSSSSHSISTWSTDRTVSVSWSGASDAGGSGISGYSWEWSLVEGTVPDAVEDGEGTSATSSSLPDGWHWFHVRSRDNAGNWANGAKHYGPFWIDNTKPYNPSGVISFSHSLSSWSSNPIISVEWTGAHDGNGSGISGYSYNWSTSSTTTPNTTQDTTGTSATSPSLPDGTGWYFHVRSRDRVGLWADGARHYGPFWIDSTAPSNPTDVTSTSHNLSFCSPDPTIDVSWSGATDGIGSGINGYSYDWTTSPTSLPNTVQNTVGTISTSPVLSPGSDWYFHVRSQDNAGNWSEEATHFGPLCVSNPTKIVCWGRNVYGICDVPLPNEDFVGVAAGRWHSLGLKADGTVIAWGNNEEGQCDVPSPNEDFVGIATHDWHSLCLKADATVVAWGNNDYGQCDVPSPNENFVGIALGYFHSLGLKADGTVVAWGSNGYGQCDVPSPNSNFVGIDAGWWHSLGLKADGTVVAWGDNEYGQCDVPSPNSDFVAVAPGYSHSLGLKTDGTVMAWGDNEFGQCDVPSPNENFVGIAASYGYSLGLKANGTVVAWGKNNYGQCDVPDPNICYTAISAGTAHSLALSNPLIELTRPKGGEILQGGSDYAICWQRWGNPADSISILLSLDSGASYTHTVASGLAGTDTSYSWTVNNYPVETCRLKVVTYYGVEVGGYDYNDEDFTITGLPRRYASLTGGNRHPYSLPEWAAHDIQDAIDAAAEGDTVFVAAGVHSGGFTSTKPLIFWGGWDSAFEIQDPSTYASTLSGSGSLILFSEVDSGVCGVEGFTFGGGSGTALAAPEAGIYGGGVLSTNSSYTVIKDNIFNGSGYVSSSGFSAGGAIACVNSGSAYISGNTMNDCEAQSGGGIYLFHTDAVISGNHISGSLPDPSFTGTKNGGGIYTWHSEVRMSGNYIGGCSGYVNGGGVYARFSPVTMSGDSIASNSCSASGAGIYSMYSAIDAEDAVITGNTASSTGGGIYFKDESLDMYNSLLSLNVSSIIGGGMYADSVSGSVVNNTFNSNSGAAGGNIFLSNCEGLDIRNNLLTGASQYSVSFGAVGTLTCQYNNSYGNTPGDFNGYTPDGTNIGSDPLYVDSGSGDYHLALHSASIDAGDPFHSDPDGSRSDHGMYGGERAVMGAPEYVKSLSAAAVNDTTIQLNWDELAGGGLDFYAVYGDTASGFVPNATVYLGTVSAGTTTFDHYPVDTCWYYSVSGVNTDGYAGGYSDQAGACTTGPDSEPPMVTVTYPNGGEIFNVDDVIDIEWIATDNIGVDSVNMYYSVNGGGGYSLIAGSEPNDSSYTWVVPAPASDSCLIKVVAFDAVLLMGEGTSDSLFTIQDITDVDDDPEVRFVHHLEQNHPNPFNGTTTIAYTVGSRSRVDLKIFDTSGRLVRTLEERRRDPGRYEVVWNGRDDYGRAMTSGVYFCRISVDDYSQSKKVIYLR